MRRSANSDDEDAAEGGTGREQAQRQQLPRVYRSKVGRTAAAAALIELVLIAAVSNQGVTNAFTKRLATGNHADYSRGAMQSALAFSWRFSPASGQPTHTWAAQLAGIGTLVVLTVIGVLIVARGSVTFGRVWVAVWAVVAACAPVAIMVRNVLIIPSKPGPDESRIGQAVYAYPDFGPVIVAGLVLGLISGLIAALVALIARRTVDLAAATRSEEDGEYYDPNSAPGYRPPPWGEEAAEQPTTAYPAAGYAAATQGSGYSAGAPAGYGASYASGGYGGAPYGSGPAGYGTQQLPPSADAPTTVGPAAGAAAVGVGATGGATDLSPGDHRDATDETTTMEAVSDRATHGEPGLPGQPGNEPAGSDQQPAPQAEAPQAEAPQHGDARFTHDDETTTMPAISDDDEGYHYRPDGSGSGG